MKIILILFWGFAQYASAKPYKVKLFIAQLPPWVEIQNSMCLSGPICDFFSQLNLQSDINIKYEVSSLARLNLAAYGGKLEMGLFPKLSVFDKNYEVVGKVYAYKLGYYSRALDKNFKGKKKCATPKSPHKEEGVKYLEVSDLHQCFKMLMNKRIGSILITDIELALFLSENPSYAVGEFHSTKKLALWLYVNNKMSKGAKASIFKFFNSFDGQQIQNKYLIKSK